MTSTATERIVAAALVKASGTLRVGEVRKAAEQVLPHWNDRGPVPSYVVQQCLQLAGRTVTTREAAPLTVQFSGYARISGAQMLGKIEETVRWLRYSYFHTSHRVSSPDAPGERAPFASYEEALEWLETSRRATRLARLSPKEAERRIELLEKLERLSSEFEELTGWTIPPPEPTVTISFPGRGGRERQLICGRLDALFAFALWIRQLALWSGFEESDLVRYLLCGERPTLPAAKIRVDRHSGTLPDMTTLRREQVLIELRTPALGRAQTERLVGLIGEQWRQSGLALPTGNLNSEDSILYEIMVELGGASRAEQPYGYWPEVARRWEERGQRRVTTKALMKRWRKVQARIPSDAPNTRPTKTKGAK